MQHQVLVLYSHQDSGSPLTKNLLINAHRPSITTPSLKLSTILYYLLQVPVFKKKKTTWRAAGSSTSIMDTPTIKGH